MWEGLDPATCMPDHCFCEAVRDGWVRQPANTGSSLTFCAAAAVMALEKRRGLEAWCFVIAVFLVGATSAVYHASLSFIGQTLDVQSMYLLVLAVVALNLDDLRPGKPRRFLFTYLASNAALGVVLVAAPELRRYAFGAAIALIAGTEALLRRKKLRDWPLMPLFAAAGVQGVAFGIWVLDTTRAVCWPHSLAQGHAVWHTLGAVATLGLWRYLGAPGRRAPPAPPR